MQQAKNTSYIMFKLPLDLKKEVEAQALKIGAPSMSDYIRQKLAVDNLKKAHKLERIVNDCLDLIDNRENNDYQHINYLVDHFREELDKLN